MIFKVLFRAFWLTFFVWVILSTAIPQILLKHSPSPLGTDFSIQLLPSILHNSQVVYVIAHPDDEVMFFAPLVLELSKPLHDNTILIICFSDGDADGLGQVRRQELHRLAKMLGIGEVTILDYEDGMNITWEADAVVLSLRKHVPRGATVITFDNEGVSGHPNHISLYHGAVQFAKNHSHTLYKLKLVHFVEKYSATLLTSVELFFHYVTKLVNLVFRVNVNISFYPANTLEMRFYSDLNMMAAAYGAMMYGHYSQMVWFRYGWLLLSRYLTFNHLIKV